VVGFLSPSRHDNSLGYVFTSRDAHAWPELFFAGVGWVRFEPTPGNGAVIPPYTHAVSIPHVGSGRPTQSTPTSPGAAGGKNPTEGGPTTAAAGGTQGTGGGGGSVPPLGWLVLVVVVALALTPGLIRWGVRRSRMARAIDGCPSCEFAWLELRDRVVDLRLPWTGSLTPRARRRFVEPLLGGDPDGVAALDRLSLTVERARYAGSPLTDAQPSSDAREVMAAIGRGADWKQRLVPLAGLTDARDPRRLVPDGLAVASPGAVSALTSRRAHRHRARRACSEGDAKARLSSRRGDDASDPPCGS
jgi:hypothetical protein